MQVYVHTDLYNAGSAFQIHEYTAELYYVVIESENGERLGHDCSFYGAKKVMTEDGIGFLDVRSAARAEAEKLRDQVFEAMKQKGLSALNMAHWCELQPAYGSRAYQLKECLNG